MDGEPQKQEKPITVERHISHCLPVPFGQVHHRQQCHHGDETYQEPAIKAFKHVDGPTTQIIIELSLYLLKGTPLKQKVYLNKQKKI